MPCWDKVLAPAIRSDLHLVVAGRGNSILALVKYLDGIGDADIVGVNIPNGIFGADDMQRITRWLNRAETAFLLAPGDPRAHYRVRIFTLDRRRRR